MSTQTISDRLDQEAVKWDPEEGDKLVGTLVELGEYSGGDYEPCPVLKIETEDGEQRLVYASRTALRSRVEEAADLRVGDLVGIKFVGKRESKAGQSYFDYRFVSEHPSISDALDDGGPFAKKAAAKKAAA